jgi:hypothetical protein
MRRVKFLALTAIAGLGIAASAPRTEAQVSIGIGVAPACPYGYFENPPYGCAPYGYYGPEWFSNGVFIGAGPWFHGPEHFHGYVDNHYHPEHGYRGEYPHNGDRARDGWRGSPEHFHGNEWHDGHGHGHEEHHSRSSPNYKQIGLVPGPAASPRLDLKPAQREWAEVDLTLPIQFLQLIP